jgi:hypothetical protein
MSEPESPTREAQVLNPRDLDARISSPRDLNPRDPNPRNLDARVPDPRILDPRLLDPRNLGSRDLNPRDLDPRDLDPRIAGPRTSERPPLSLPHVRSAGVNPPPEPGETRRVMPMPAPPRGSGRAAALDDPPERPTAMQRVMHGIRSALPLAQKVLPLLDGQILTAISNLLAPHVAHPAPAADLKPLEGDLADLRTRHIELYGKVIEQSAATRRVAERLEKVQEASERNAQEQQELKESVQTIGRKANLIAILALSLAAVSIAANVFFFFHFRR